MKKELAEKLTNEFPLLFGKPDDYDGSSFYLFGFACGDGWFQILWDAGMKLEPLLREWVNQNPSHSWRPRCSTIKEKYGTLRFYLTSGTQEMFNITNEAEERSESVCETCGQPGVLRGESWYFTACEEHSRGQAPAEESYEDEDD